MKACIILSVIMVAMAGCATVKTPPPKQTRSLDTTNPTGVTQREVAWNQYKASAAEADRRGLTGRARVAFMRPAINAVLAASKAPR